MLQRWTGPIVVVLILGGVILILAMNLNLEGWDSQRPRSPDATPAPNAAGARRDRLGCWCSESFAPAGRLSRISDW